MILAKEVTKNESQMALSHIFLEITFTSDFALRRI